MEEVCNLIGERAIGCEGGFLGDCNGECSDGLEAVESPFTGEGIEHGDVNADGDVNAANVELTAPLRVGTVVVSTSNAALF